MPHEAATLARVDTRTIYRWIETAQIHFTETAEGQMLVCLGSLSDFADRRFRSPNVSVNPNSSTKEDNHAFSLQYRKQS
jgi:predicted site-specific integrase-resolvase